MRARLLRTPRPYVADLPRRWSGDVDGRLVRLCAALALPRQAPSPYGQAAVRTAIAAEEIGRPVSYRPVETDGAARAAALLAELI